MHLGFLTSSSWPLGYGVTGYNPTTGSTVLNSKTHEQKRYSNISNMRFYLFEGNNKVHDTSIFESLYQWQFQDPMEVLHHIRPYFVGIFPYIGLL